MNDRFKFRAWGKEDKEFFTWKMIIQHLELSDLESDQFIFQQCTGLKDKNGKFIFEGDIVEWDDGSNGKWRRRCQVIYVPAHYRLVGYYYDVSKPIKHTPIEFDCGAFIYENDGELEVIGNIYENPDLLK